ncbi:MAG: hypothetical protein PHW96_02680 [Candidatus Nanoarchaeia archaeon]|nr:hypothetical protein [Candidatus Nanoarchaeia archaeon]
MKSVAAVVMVLFVLFLTLNFIKTEDNVCISGNRDFILNLKVEKHGSEIPISVELINVGAKNHEISSECVVQLIIHNKDTIWRDSECLSGRYNYSDSVYYQIYTFSENWTYLGGTTPSTGAYTANAIFSYIKDGEVKDLICSLNFNLI